MRATRGVVAVLAVASVLTAAACTDDSSEPEPSPSPSSSAVVPDKLTFGVFGPREEVRAFQANVDAWNSDPEHVHVELESWATQAAMRAEVERGGDLPDVFLSSRSDLAWLLEGKHTQPVDQLLDDRGVEFGDNYSREALEAFSAEEHLQCMPYGVTPDVIYVNKRLVNFDRMRKRGLDVPDPDATSWSFDQFTAAAEFASRPARNTKGVHIAPTLEGLAPFISSGGGTVFDDADQPKSVTFSSDGSKDALERTLELLRNPQVTLDESQLDQASALSWFLRGKLGMIAGDRSLVPTLRRKANLLFDVMPMPRLDSAATVGDVTGLCISSKTPSAALAADFMVHEIDRESVGEVARTGYLQPANVAVALSEDFLQPALRPLHAELFSSAVRSMNVAPLIDTLPALEAAVAPDLQQMVYGVGVLDLDAVTSDIDETSKPILDPESVSDSPSPSESSSE